MVNSVSDEDSLDSDSGIRFKTTNTRNKSENVYSKECSKKERSSKSYSYKYSSKRDNLGQEKCNKYRHKRSDISSDISIQNLGKSMEHCKNKQNDCNLHVNNSIAKYKSSKTHTHKLKNHMIEKYDKYKGSSKAEKESISNNSKTKHKKYLNEPLKHSDDYLKVSEESSNIKHYDPSLPSKIICEDKSSVIKHADNLDNYAGAYGPAIPDYLIKKSNQESDTKKQINSSVLPNSSKHVLATKPSDSTEEKNKILGPVLPPHLRNLLLTNTDNTQNVVDTYSIESDDEMIGPLPPGQSSNHLGYIKLEERALQLKIEGFTKTDNEEIVREEWMLKLPEVHTGNLGLGPRQFRAKGVPDMSDRSSWTDTPQNKKQKKVDLKKETELRQIKCRDQEQEVVIAKTNKKREKSLMDIHQAKLNEKKVPNF